MLRINLLPAYIAEQKKTLAAWWITGVGLALVLAGLLAWALWIRQQVADMTQAANDADTAATAVEKTQSDADAERQKVAPIKAKRDFVNNVRFYNTLRPRIYRQAAQYTLRNAEYNSMAVQGDTLSMSAYVRSISDVARFYITLYNNPDIKALSVRGLPGWPNASTVPLAPGTTGNDPNRNVIPLAVTAQLIKPIGAPAPPGGGAAVGGGRPGGGLGGPPGGGGYGGYGAGIGGPPVGGPPVAGGGPRAGGRGEE
jgi:hypothetical protein